MAETKIPHNFTNPVEETATELAKIILQRVVDNKDDLIYKYNDRTPEMEKETVEKSTDFAISIAKVIAPTDLPADYVGLPIDKIIVMLEGLKNYLNGTVRQMEDEYLSRSYGVKSPETGKFRQECITFGHLYLKLDEAREATGNNSEDYFITK